MLINKLPNWLLAWPRPFKRAVAVAVDVLLCVFTLWLSMSLRLEQLLSLSDLPLHLVVMSVGLAIPLFMHFGLYRAIFRYAGLNAIFAIGRAVGLYALVFTTVYSVIGLPGVPRSVGVSQPLLLLLLVGLSRTAVRYWLGGIYRDMISGKGAAQVLIYGAGSAGRQLAAGLAASKSMNVVGYLDDDGPITLTHADVTRYFMTIPEAAQLVIQAGAMASGGDVYVLDMGQPVKISDLARRMVVLSGLTIKDEEHPGGDIELQVKGLRPGEKLYEELLIGDNPLPTHHPRIMKAHEEFLLWEDLHDKLQALSLALDVNDVPHIRKQLKYLVPGYQPEGDVVDWVWMENEKLSMV